MLDLSGVLGADMFALCQETRKDEDALRQLASSVNKSYDSTLASSVSSLPTLLPGSNLHNSTCSSSTEPYASSGDIPTLHSLSLLLPSSNSMLSPPRCALSADGDHRGDR